ncbi:ParA family protein [Pollutimonas harenae]|uniref:ParA family protein n=1 Tax=Pollutimonas harenae TaxID=657015 RepID=A0A853GWK8_9BURK|nr:AAA family ATPase [Pollutimonas harenae]NYT86731.1 ParA family protein [Pollutimonas harenae]TEA71381.1 ParA family protein [Pollutimonas harenae]
MKIIACYSNKGGVGKTATSVNLAYAMAASGHKTLLCDLDPQGASGFYFRVKPSKRLTNTAFFKDAGKFADAIRGSDYDNLDILPANMSFRDFDVFLSQMHHSHNRLQKSLKSVKEDYDVIVLDCPPTISTLSENVFRSANAIVVPVIPTTLSERTFEQLLAFFKESKLPVQKLHGFFSMVQGVKTLHIETMEAMGDKFRKRFLHTHIPFASDIERMGVYRAPVLATAPNSPAGMAYYELSKEIMKKIN